MPRHHEGAVHEIEVRPTDPGPTRLGKRFASRGKQGKRWWRSDLEVTAYERPDRFAFSLRRVDPILNRDLRFRLVTLAAPLLNLYVRGIRVRTVENLKRRLEALPKTPSG